jgi:hypothetical protein
MTHTFLIALLLIAAVTAQPSACPDLSALRSSYIVNSFNVSRIAGLWYEAAYQDLAQVGAKCQTLVNTVPSNDSSKYDGFTQQFKVLYGPLPFTLDSVYTPVNSTAGMYHRSLQGFDLLPLPSVIVDVKVDSVTGDYTALTDYLCASILGIVYIEVRFLFRASNTSGTDIMAMVERAAALGLVWQKLDFNNFASCPSA